MIGGQSAAAKFAAAMVDRNGCRLGGPLVQETVAGAVLLGIDALLVRDKIVIGLFEDCPVLIMSQAESSLGILQNPSGRFIGRNIKVEDPTAAIAGIGVGVFDQPDARALDGVGHPE